MRQGTAVRVDNDRCRRVASIIGAVDVPVPAEEGPLAGIIESAVPNFYFVLVAICHQTSPMGQTQLSGKLKDGTTASGWDYLRKRFLDRAVERSELLDPNAWLSTTTDAVERMFEDEDHQRTLIGSDRRAMLIRDLGQRFRALGVNDIRAVYVQSQGWLRRPDGGMYQLLRSFEAYRDPIQKKSSFFLELARGQAGWTFKDPEALSPPVDYHEVRGHLRLGTVVVEDAGLRERLRTGADVSSVEDTDIRGAVQEAIERVSSHHGKVSCSRLHYLFWNTFRNCCK